MIVQAGQTPSATHYVSVVS